MRFKYWYFQQFVNKRRVITSAILLLVKTQTISKQTFHYRMSWDICKELAPSTSTACSISSYFVDNRKEQNRGEDRIVAETSTLNRCMFRYELSVHVYRGDTVFASLVHMLASICLLLDTLIINPRVCQLVDSDQIQADSKLLNLFEKSKWLTNGLWCDGMINIFDATQLLEFMEFV